MSRGQENQVIDESKSQNQTQFNNAQTAFNQAQGDISTEQGDIKNYQNQLAQFAAANPYKAGGEYQTETNKIAANTADATAQAGAQTLQGLAARTGGNPAAVIAATTNMQQQSDRALSGQEAAANQSRIGDEAGYNKEVLGASSLPASLEGSLAGQEGSLSANQGDLATKDLGIQQDASNTPGFWDTLGDSFANSFGKAAGGATSGMLFGCWIAAELYGGWADPRTVLVRLWLHFEFRKRWYGPAVLWAYERWGERVAAAIRKPENWRWRDAFEELFGVALVDGKNWAQTPRGWLIFDQYYTALARLKQVSTSIKTEQLFSEAALTAVHIWQKQSPFRYRRDRSEPATENPAKVVI